MLREVITFCFIICAISVNSQTIEISKTRKHVKRSGDVCAALIPAAALTSVIIYKDWKGLKQGVYTGISTLGITYALKYATQKERPDHSNKHSFPSMHSSVSYASATFLQRRYGWKFGLPAYIASTYIAWSRVYAKKHDWWDIMAGAVIGSGCSLLFTRPFSKKFSLEICPLANDTHCGIYASMKF